MLSAARLGWPFAPPASVEPLQAKLLSVSASVMLFPAVPADAAVTVTVPLLDAAVTPAALVRLSAFVKFVASVVGLEEMEKFAPVSLPLRPPLKDAPLHEKMPALFDCPAKMPFAPLPSVAAVRLTALPIATAVTPTVERVQALIATARLVAKTDGAALVA